MATTEEKERWFKGHRQPEINERLDQINNFLADEDVYRCPDFDSKFEVIRDYLKYIFNEGFRYDVDKFSDAKAKCNIHVSTIGTGWEGLPPKSHIYAKNDKNSTICILRSLRETGKLQSNRLIAQEVGSTTRKKEILLRGMRSNHPPFKIDDDFADGFEEAFKADWYQDPKSIDDEEEYEDTNLVHLEGKAYIHALENPTAIPVLLHNLENAFLRDYYDDPWDLELNKNQTDDFELSDEFLNAGFTVGILRRLEKTEDLMNDILKKWPKVTRTQYEDFMQSVEPYAPSEIKALKEQILRLKTWGCRLGWAEFGRVEKWVNNNLANYYELQRSCRRKLNEWIKKLKINGVSLVPAVQDDQCVIILQPRAKPVVDSLSKGTVTTCQWPIPDESDSIDLGGVAEIRGTRRAAVELALNLFATNKEQHRPNQRFRRVELPKPRPQIPDEVPLCLPVEPEDREAEQDPFKFTKAMFHLRKSLQVEYSNAIKSEKGGADNAGWILPADYDGPLVILTGEELCDRIRKKIEPLKALLIKMAEAGGPYPRPFLQHIKLIVDQSMKATMDPTGDKEPLDSDEFRLLESLTEEQKPVAWDELETIGHHSSYCRPDFEWKLHIPWFKSVIDILETCGGVPLPHKGSPKLFQGSQEYVTFLGEPKGHRAKIKAIQEYVESRAVKLGREIRYLTDKLAKESQSAPLVPIAQLRNGELPTPNNTPLIELAKEVLECSPDLGKEAGITITPGFENLTADQAAKVIQQQIIVEAFNNWDWIYPEEDNVWGFATYRKPKRPFFSLDKWPVFEDTNSGYEYTDSDSDWSESDDTYTARTTRKRKRPEKGGMGRDGIYRLRKGERYNAGPAVIPFGETPYQRAAQSFIVSDDLSSAAILRAEPGGDGRELNEHDKNAPVNAI